MKQMHLFRKPLSEAAGYALTALIVVVVWMLGVLATNLDFEYLAASGSSNSAEIETNNVKTAVRLCVQQKPGAPKAKHLQEEYSFEDPNGSLSGKKLTIFYVSGQYKGGDLDGLYFICHAGRVGEGKDAHVDAELIGSYVTREQLENCLDVLVYSAEKVVYPNQPHEAPDPQLEAKGYLVSEGYMVEDLETKYEKKYQTQIAEGEWVDATTSFQFATRSVMIEQTEGGYSVIGPEYVVVWVVASDAFSESDISIEIQADSEAERDEQWKAYLPQIEQQMQELVQSGDIRNVK